MEHRSNRVYGQRTAQQLKNSVDLYAAGQQAILLAEGAVSTSTRRAYERPQKEWQVLENSPYDEIRQNVY